SSLLRPLLRPPLFPYTTLFRSDVTLISAISVGYLVAQRGDVAVNSRVTYPAYFLALAATCLRYDVRICIVTGFTAVVEYAAIVRSEEHTSELHSLTISYALFFF